MSIGQYRQEFAESEEGQRLLRERSGYSRPVTGSSIDGGAATMKEDRRKEIVRLLKRLTQLIIEDEE